MLYQIRTQVWLNERIIKLDNNPSVSSFYLYTILVMFCTNYMDKMESSCCWNLNEFVLTKF